MISLRVLACLGATIGCAQTATHNVGQGRTYTTLQAAFNALDLGSGDIVEVDGAVTYDVVASGIMMDAGDSGAPGNPAIARGISVGGARPLLRGGTNTIEFRSRAREHCLPVQRRSLRPCAATLAV